MPYYLAELKNRRKSLQKIMFLVVIQMCLFLLVVFWVWGVGWELRLCQF